MLGGVTARRVAPAGADDLRYGPVVVSDRSGAVPGDRLAGRLAMRGVCFTYPGRPDDKTTPDEALPALSDVGFEIPPGQVLALVGFPGAGKSTIARLVTRAYDPDEGAVLVDDGDVRELARSSLLTQVSQVLGDMALAGGTVAENIVDDLPGVTQQQIEAAARDANAHAFITALPEGYQTRLAPDDARLSRSQRQRIAIARAFVRDTPILILDEPTAGLDLASAWLVDAALHKLMRGRTTILISRDLGLIRSAARILVVSDGRIVERGTHERLLAGGRTYAELYVNHLHYGDRSVRSAVDVTAAGAGGAEAAADTAPPVLSSGPTTDPPTEAPPTMPGVVDQPVLVSSAQPKPDGQSPNGSGAAGHAPAPVAGTTLETDRPDQPHESRDAAPTSSPVARSAGFSTWQRAVIAGSTVIVITDVVILLVQR
jgi:ABC-type multidrug transport system ATPase subunit